ncbi:hypothetical protein ACFE04_030528 [Oxalis oulophora]
MYLFTTVFVYFSLLLFVVSTQTTTQTDVLPAHIGRYCEDPISTYETDSLFQTNLNYLLYSIPSYTYTGVTVTPNNTNRWSTDTLLSYTTNQTSTTTTTPNYTVIQDFLLGDGFIYTSATDLNLTQPAYVQSLCRGDLSSHNCQNCVAFATTDTKQRCPTDKDVISWYDKCHIRYSDKAFLSELVDSYKIIYMSNTDDIPHFNNTNFDLLLTTTMNDTATKAVNSLQRFATAEVNINATQKLYSLVQCTPDISRLDCDSCLRTSIAQLPDCCQGKQGGQILNPSCNIRYEIYLFYNLDTTIAPAPGPIAMDPLPPPPASPPLSPPPPGKGISSSKRVIAIVAPIVAVLLFFLSIVSYWLLKRRTRRKINRDTMEETDLEGMSTMEALPFDFETIRGATDEFSQVNKLGGGGFGEVYKIL